MDDATRSVSEAIRRFDRLRSDERDACPKRFRDLADHYYVVSQYYKALVEPPCSPSAVSALEKTGVDLEKYIMAHDGDLLAVYAQDIYGLVWLELARCREDPRQRFECFSKAFDWFETCVHTKDGGPDHLRIITRGYYHLAQAGLDAGSMPQRDFQRDALIHLESMLEKHPTAWRLDNGLLAMIEWSKLECARGNANQAIEVALMAAGRAKTAGKPSFERAANRLLGDYVSGDCGTVVGSLDPDVLRRVADDLYWQREFETAIRAYRAVIASTHRTAEDFVAYRWHAWKRMALAYRRLGDRLAEALAYEPIHEAWVQGRIPHEKRNYADSNSIEAINNRRRAQEAVKHLVDLTETEAFRTYHQRIGLSFFEDFPKHAGPHYSEWGEALRQWGLARESKRDGESDWEEPLGKAYESFVRISGDDQHHRQDAAWVFRIRAQYMREHFAAAVEDAEAAWARWNGTEARAQAAEFETVRLRRLRAQAAAEYWTAASLQKLERHAEAAGRLTGWHERYPEAQIPYPSLVYDILIQAHVALEDIETADRHYRALLTEDPEYGNLARLTQELAGCFNEQRSEINTQLAEAAGQLSEARREYRRADRETYRLGALVVDLRSRLAQVRAAGDRGLVRELEELISKAEAELRECGPRRNAAEARFHSCRAAVAELRAQLYEPLLRAATYWHAWDQSLVATEAERDWRNVRIFAHMFLELGRLRPKERANWERARELFEGYVSLVDAADPPPLEELRRQTCSDLGEVLVGLARLETDAAARAALVERAIEVLAGALGANAAERNLVVEMLADRILVLNWREGGKRWRFPVPVCRTVEELRKATLNLPPSQAARALQRLVSSMDDKGLEGLVNRDPKSLFDPVLYRELANADVAFRLNLAQAFAWSADVDDVTRAINLALSLVRPPLALEADCDEWWAARAIQLECYLRMARHRRQHADPDDAAVRWLDRAEKVLEGVTAIYPHLGSRDQERWAAIRAELEAVQALVKR